MTLLLAMFALVFGPKILVYGDVISAVSLTLIARGVFRRGRTPVPPTVSANVRLFAFSFLALTAYAGCLLVARSEADSYQFLRFGRVLVNFMGAFFLVRLYFDRYGDSAKEVIVWHLFQCLVIHALIMALIFAVPPFRTFLIETLLQVPRTSRSYDALMSGYRVSGLTLSWDALSGLQAVGVLLIPVIASNLRRVSRAYLVAATPLLVFSVIISGRTGLFVFLILAPISTLYSGLARVARGTMPVLVGLGCAAALLFFALSSPSIGSHVGGSSVGRYRELVGFFGSGSRAGTRSSGDTIETYTKQYFLPDAADELVFGLGGSGRQRRNYFIRSDNGPTLNVHNIGLVGTLPLYVLTAMGLLAAVRARRRNRLVSACCVITTLAIVLIDLKVNYVLARNGFSMMAIMFVTTWWLQRPGPRGSSAHPGRPRVLAIR